MRDAEFDAIMTAHQEAVQRAARRLLRQGEDAKDAAQEVFLRLLRSRSNVHGDVGAWLYRVTVNVCKDHYRRRRPTLELRPQTADPAPSPECLLRFRERKRLLGEGLNVLTKRERAALVLRDIRGFSAAEVGAMLEIKEVTVRGHIHTARTKLADYVRNPHLGIREQCFQLCEHFWCNAPPLPAETTRTAKKRGSDPRGMGT
jgi:RNA polymerase sigma-70 factor (ECF subfamily)